MNAATGARFTHPPIRERRTDVMLWPLAALMIIAAVSAAPVQGEAADVRSSVASHIPYALADPVRPLAVIDRTDIELSGMSNVSDLLLSRLDYNSFGVHRPFVLGSGRVAILIDGRRVSDTTVDLDTLPISAVERIEVLSGSAAALHGGHAIGGAVNIVLRRDYDGVEVQGSIAQPTSAGGDSEHGSALWGGAVGRGHMTLGVDVFRRQEIRDADRDYSRASWTPGGRFADASGVSVGGNTVFIATDDGTIARPLGDCAGSAYTGVLAEPRGLPGTGCGFAYADISWGSARYERESLFLDLDHPIGEDADMYFDVRIAKGNTRERYAPSVGTFSFTPSNALERQLLQDPEIGALPDKLRVSHRFLGHGNREWRTDLEEYDLTLGLEGRFAGGIGYDMHLRYFRHDTVVDGDTFVSDSVIERAIDEGDYDLENPLSTAPEHLAAIRRTGLRLTRERVTDHKTIRASLDGKMFALGGGAARWAAGAEVASEDWRDVHDYRDVSGGSHEASDVLGSGGILAAGERRRWSGFAELSLPLLDDWNVVLAGRRDDHDDVGATLSHQVASRYKLHEALTLRGSWDRGSKAPGLRALHLRGSIDYPYVCDTRTLTVTGEECDETQVERVSGGNPNLEPDKAESVSFGAVTSLGPLSLSADWFRIGLSDVPAQLSAQSIIDLDAEGRLPPGAAVIREGDLITRIESPLVNSGETDVSGIDLRARAGWKADWADLVLDARWSRVTGYERKVAGEVQPGDYPRDRVHASLRASRNGVTASWNVHAVSGYWNESRTGRYEGWTGHDVTVRWNDAFGLGGLDLAGGVLNVSDRGPSIDPTNPDQPDVTLDSARGRTIFLTATMSW